MTPGEFKEIAKVMQECGIVYLQMDNCTIKRPNGSFTKHIPSPIAGSQQESHGLPQGITTHPSDPIAHVNESLTSLLKLNDRDLVDQLFPDAQDESA